MGNKKHKLKNITYNGQNKRFGTWSGDCNCGKWSGSGSTRQKLNEAFSEHINGN